MPDDKTIREPLDKKRINIHEPYEVRWWTKALGCDEEKLKSAVKKVGDSADKVREHLKKK